jgi:DNA-binding transcriptional LysR family regulator
MTKEEDVFGVALFDRTKNRIRLNDNGTHAAQEITTLLKQTDEMIARVRAFDRASRTIAIGSAAALELPDLIGTISHLFPQKSITTELVLPKDLLQGLREGVCQLVILPGDPGQEVVEREKLAICRIGEEHLMFYLPKDHPLSDLPSLTLADLNGENMLLFSEIGFWGDLVRKKMPDSRFLMQSERYTFSELIANSVLPCFTTDLSLRLRAGILGNSIAEMKASPLPRLQRIA